MNFQEILNIANRNKAEAEYEASRNRYSTELPPPKKLPKSSVQSNAVKLFLARKQMEDQRKAEEARQKKAELLALRAQNTKNNKKAKIMASRTKDNDFSKIKLTEDEVEAKKKREDELRRLALKDKVERMKARIELEEKEKLLPKKRKRKSKLGEHEDESHNYNAADEAHEEPKKSHNGIKKPPVAAPALNFYDLLKVAETKQYEPVLLPKVKDDDDDDRPLTKKAKRLLQEEENRIKRKLAAEAAAKSGKSQFHDFIEKQVANNVPTKFNKIPKLASSKAPQLKTETNSASSKNPHVVHVQKDSKNLQGKQKLSNDSKSLGSSVKSNSHISKNGTSVKHFKPSQINPAIAKPKSMPSNSTPKSNSLTNFKDKQKVVLPTKSKKPPSPPGTFIKNKQGNDIKKVPEEKKPKPPSDSPSNGDIESLMEKKLAEMEKRIRLQVQKEMEEKLKQKLLTTPGSITASTAQNKPDSQFRTNGQKATPPGKSTPVNKVPSDGKVLNGQKLVPKGTVTNLKAHNGVKAGQLEPQKKLAPKAPVPFERQKKPAFHPNPYLAPPRRILESHRPISRVRRRVESDDDDDEDDDMSDFIDDGPALIDDEDYSKHIKEIFGYDKSRYVDDEEDEVMETSFGEQMKEETRSAKIGYLEDLEDIRKEKEELARKKMKKKKMK